MRLAKQCDLQVAKLVDAESNRNAVGPISGDYTREEALRLLLKGTGLTYRFANHNTVAIVHRTGVRPCPTCTPLPQQAPSTSTLDASDRNFDNLTRHGSDRMGSQTASQRPRGFWYRILHFFVGPRTPEVTQHAGRKAAAWAAICATAAASGVVCAQGASTHAGDTPDMKGVKLEEIVVTAERRVQNVERTPLAITAISGSMLSTLGVSRATDLNGLVPNVHIANAGGTSANISIRGVVSTNDTEVGDPAVAFNVDGVYMARPRDALTSFYDIKRIEVLRGPQGTLYGRNATAGAINIITNHPDLSRAYGQASITYGNYSELKTYGMANIPVSSTFGLRAAFQTNRHSGYSNNFPAQRYNDLESTAGRVEALWNPLTNLSALLTVDYYHAGGMGGGSFFATTPIGLYAADTGATPYSYAVVGNGYNNQTASGVTLRVNWELPWATVTYLGNYRSDGWHSQTGQRVAGPNASACQTASSASCQTLTNFTLEHQTSHELRFSRNTENLKWVVGLYYFREHNNVFLGITPIPGINVIAFRQPSVVEKSKAVFGQITYSLTKRLRLIAGARYNQDKKTRTGATEAFGSIVGEGCPACVPLYDNYADLSWNKFTWKAGLDFDLNPQSILYATVATGYKAGGYGDGVPPNNNPYKPETILAYELGTKNMLLNHKLQVNVDAFYDRYSDYQASAVALVAGQPSTVTLNAGKATIFGLELETKALLTPRDQVSFNASYLHAYYTQFYLPLGDPFNSGPVSYAGNTLPNAPHVSLRFSYQHVFPLNDGAALVPRIDTGWTAKQNMDFHNYAVTEQGSYTRTDLTLTYQAPKTWQAMLYVRNVENKDVFSSAAPDSQAISHAIGRTAGFATYMPPRTYGIEISASY